MDVREALLSMTAPPPRTGRHSRSRDLEHLYAYSHDLDNVADDKRDVLRRFLFATMDESRLYYAEEYAGHVLRFCGLGAVAPLRRGVVRREVSNDLDYDRHRDHASHTLNLYLLGWYFYVHCPQLRGEFAKHAATRLGYARRGGNADHQTFAATWPYVSLLHDVGYMLEGSLLSSGTLVQSERIERGVAIVNDFFRYELWDSMGLHFAGTAEYVCELIGAQLPTISAASLNEVANSLRHLGDLSRLKQHVLDGEGFSGDYLLKQRAFPTDAFELWNLHYEIHSPKMADRLGLVEAAFRDTMNHGIVPLGIRVLDHGVCSGLLLLRIGTLLKQITLQMPHAEPKSGAQAEIKEKFESSEDHWLRDSKWWPEVVWASGAAAVHNFEQAWPDAFRPKKKLTLQDDPLAFLGVLVDIIQDWDRSTSAGDAALMKRLPLQATEVDVEVVGDRVCFAFEDSGVASRLQKELSKCLTGWQKLCGIQESSWADGRKKATGAKVAKKKVAKKKAPRRKGTGS